MADFTDAALKTALWPPGGVESDWQRLEPLLSPLELKALFLAGIPLVSQMEDPITRQKMVITDDALQVHIKKAMDLAEAATGLVFMPTDISERLPLDRNEFERNGYVQVKRRPVWGVRQVTVQTPHGDDLYQLPQEWIEMGNAYRGQVNIIPLFPFGATAIIPMASAASGAAGSVFLTAIASQVSPWTAAYFNIRYVTGFKDGLVPSLVNELVGTIAAIRILSMLGVTYGKTNSVSVGLDGMSQSVSTPGPNIFQGRINDLKEEKDAFVNKLKTLFGTRFAYGTI